MMNFRTLFIALTLLLGGLDAYAQFNPSIGFANSRMYGREYDKKSNLIKDRNEMNGFIVGADYNVKLPKNFSFAPGVYYTFLCSTVSTTATHTTSIEQFVDIPMHFSWNFYVLNDVRGFVYAGPAFEIGIDSREIYKAEDVKTITNNYKTDANYSRYDLMVSAGAGLEFLGMARLTLGYSYGVLDRYKGPKSLHRDQVSLGLAYIF